MRGVKKLRLLGYFRLL